MYKLSFKKNEIKKGVILNRLVVKFKHLHCLMKPFSSKISDCYTRFKFWTHCAFY